jgi:hypothetical protein
MALAWIVVNDIHPPHQREASAIAAHLPPSRRPLRQVAYRRARGRRSIWSTPESGLALVGRWLALAPSEARRLDALQEAASSLNSWVREGKIAKCDAVDRCVNAALSYELVDAYGLVAIESLIGEEFNRV